VTSDDDASASAEVASERSGGVLATNWPQLWAHLETAVAAAEEDDVLGEEEAIRAGALEALALLRQRIAEMTFREKVGFGVPASENALERFNEGILSLHQAGSLRKTEDLGYVGDYQFMGDRILVAEFRPEFAPELKDACVFQAFVMDESVNASVETAGTITTSRRPTLSRMAVGSILPGSALIPGFALAKKETWDYREMYFVLEHPEGGAVIKVDPQYGHEVRQVALAVNAAADKLRRKRAPASAPGGAAVASTAEVLTQLADLRDRGALTDEEFEREKARLFENPDDV
jgi:hypothetical protein